MKPTYKYSLFASSLIIVIDIIVYYAHLQLSPFGIFLGILSFVLMAVPLYLAIKNRRDNELGGFITLKQVMGTGLIISVLTGIIVAIFMYIQSKFIDHETTGLILKKIEENLRTSKVSQTEIDLELSAQKDFYSPLNLAFKKGLMSVLGIGFILSFICSTFLVKNPPASEN